MSEEVKRKRATARADLLASDAANSPALDALRAFFNSYEQLKGAYAARGAASDGHMSAADAKVREVFGLLSPSETASTTKAAQIDAHLLGSLPMLGRRLLGWLRRGLVFAFFRLRRPLRRLGLEGGAIGTAGAGAQPAMANGS